VHGSAPRLAGEQHLDRRDHAALAGVLALGLLDPARELLAMCEGQLVERLLCPGVVGLRRRQPC
jgi:hypothetical protein